MRLLPVLLLVFLPLSVLSTDLVLKQDQLAEQRVFYGEGPYNPQWSAFQDNGCQLTGVIPGYGSVLFEQLANQRSTFKIQPYHQAGVSIDANLMVAPPPWRHGAAVDFLPDLRRNRGNSTLSANHEISYRLLHELSIGMSPMLAYPELDLGNKRTILNLSPFQFRNALGDFRRCIANLPPFDTNKLDQINVYFASGSWELNRASKEALLKVVHQIESQDNILGVSVTGHTDSVGKPADNRVLSRKRMLQVSNYLIAQGIETSFIAETFIGQSKPALPNSNQTNRRKNRRVEILLKRSS